MCTHIHTCTYTEQMNETVTIKTCVLLFTAHGVLRTFFFAKIECDYITIAVKEYQLGPSNSLLT